MQDVEAVRPGRVNSAGRPLPAIRPEDRSSAVMYQFVTVVAAILLIATVAVLW